jgi:hypothetical protein
MIESWKHCPEAAAASSKKPLLFKNIGKQREPMAQELEEKFQIKMAN